MNRDVVYGPGPDNYGRDKPWVPPELTPEQEKVAAEAMLRALRGSGEPLPVDTQNYRAFLESAAQGCISGHISEWPQLIPSIRWALAEIKRLEDAQKQK